MQILIQAMGAEVTQEELRKNLPAEVMKSLEGKIVYPYVIAEEGTSRPKVLESGKHQVLTWPRATVKILAQAASRGTKLFLGHNKDSSHTNRPSLGEVVGTYTRTIAGKLQALAVTVLDKVQENLDVCSIEADVQMTLDGVVGDIKKLTGIALGSSDRDSPAFEGARRMGIIQCFGETSEEEPLEKGDKSMAKLTFAEVLQGIKDLNIFPHQVFSIDDIKNDNTFGKTLTQLETDLETTKTKLANIEKESQDSIRANKVSAAKADFEKLIPEGATEKQKAFMLKKFNPDKVEDLSEQGLKAQIEELQTEYAEYATMFGVKEETKGKDNSNSDNNDDVETDTVSEALGAIL